MSALLDLTLKVSVIVLVALTAVRLARGRSAAARHWVLASGIVGAAAVPLVGLAVPTWRVVTPAPEATVAVAYEALVPGATEVAPPPAALTVADLVVPIWLGGLALNFLVLLIGVARLRWLASRAIPVEDGRWFEAAGHAARLIELARQPRLLRGDHPALLVTWGLLRPKVLLPSGAESWGDERLRLVLAHELAHIRRRDWLMQIGAELLRSIYWFNPLMWIGSARLRQESEQACDDEVLRLGVGGASYASHLLDLARAFRAHRRVWVPATAIVRSSSLERRVTAMLNTQTNRRPMTPLAAGSVLAALLIVTAAVAGFEAFAQSRFAALSGTVVDQSGGVLVNATLVLANTQTNAKHEVRTNQTGFYEFVGLPAGDYELEVQQRGFQPATEAVSIGVGETRQRNVSLQIGAVQETLTMTGGAGAAAPALPVVASPPPRRPCPNPAVGGCIGPPVKLKDVRPIYPASLSDTGVEGIVLLEAQIGTDGTTKIVRVVSSPHPDLERAAIDAVSQWEFAPTTLNGSVIETQMNVSLTFRLPEAAARP